MQKKTDVTFEEVEVALKEKLAAAKMEDVQVRGICMIYFQLTEQGVFFLNLYASFMSVTQTCEKSLALHLTWLGSLNQSCGQNPISCSFI